MYSLDELTGLYGRDYMYANYDDFRCSNSMVVLFDFRHLKHINDNHGHQTGDRILKSFAKLLKDNFQKDIVTRLGGDEFLVITKNKQEEIINKIEIIKKELKEKYYSKLKNGFEPFNAGIVGTKKSFDMTYLRADLAMYDAKSKNKLYSIFTHEMLEKHEYEREFVSSVIDLIKEGEFSYLKRLIGDEITELTLLDRYGARLFTKSNNIILEKNNIIEKIDYISTDYIINNILVDGEQYMINIHNQTLMGEKDFISYLNKVMYLNKLNPNNLCVNINTFGYKGSVLSIVSKINSLKDFGYKVCIGNVNLDNQQYLLPILSFCNLDYIKVDSEVILEATNNKDIAIVITGMLSILKKKKVKPILTNLKTEQNQNDFIVRNKILIRK